MSRLKLQSILEELLGSRNVYYQPPETVKMVYPAIVYNKSNIQCTFADDLPYSKNDRYDLTVISKKVDDPVINKLIDLPYCSHSRHWVIDNLNHDLFTLYFK